jgi:hypothetical protein
MKPDIAKTKTMVNVLCNMADLISKFLPWKKPAKPAPIEFCGNLGKTGLILIMQ